MCLPQLKHDVLFMATHSVYKTRGVISYNSDMNLIDEVEKYRKSKGLKKADMARHFKVENQNYNNWVYRGSLPKDYVFAAQSLLSGKQSDRKSVKEVEPVYKARDNKIPLISWVSAGTWCESPDNYPVGDAEDWLPAPRNAGSRSFALRVINDSMTSPYPGQRSYPHGTIIYVDPDKPITNGCRVVARTNGEYTFKAYIEDAGRKYLKPINPTYDKIDITEDVHICGVVIGSYMPE